MGEVIDINTKLPKPHVCSFCLCFDCLHIWVAVQEVEFPLVGRQCPSCGQYRGVLLEALLDRWKAAETWGKPVGGPTNAAS
jgi:hypothetical protein